MIPPELIEAVAREACKQMGLDADAQGYGAILGETGWRVCKVWENNADDARKAIAFARAVKLCDMEGKG